MNVLMESAALLWEHARAYRETHGENAGAVVEMDIIRHEMLATMLEHAAATFGFANRGDSLTGGEETGREHGD